MSESFSAFRIHDQDGQIEAGFETLNLDDLSRGDIVIRTTYSDINYKDALAATGAGKILRRSPLVGGIDVAGEVIASEDSRYAKGDQILVTGCGLGETRDGGYSELVRLDANDVVRLPATLTSRKAMQLGTAGFTAALAIHRMEHNGQAPDKGPIIVTGATGGVGSLAIDMLAGRGYDVAALTGKTDADDYLKKLGASAIIRRQETDYGKRPMEKTRWAGAIDNVGGEALTWLTRTVGWWGNIASIGNAGSIKLDSTVFPFILRGINLLGINSMATPMPLRQTVWERLSSDLQPRHLDAIACHEIDFASLPDAFQPMIDNRTQGRTIVRFDGS